jgi:hypothetical protein
MKDKSRSDDTPQSVVKPFKGKIYHWHKHYIDKDLVLNVYNEDGGLGYLILGYTTKHPHMDSWKRTSWVVKHNKNGDIETRNSRYHLVGKERTH